MERAVECFASSRTPSGTTLTNSKNKTWKELVVEVRVHVWFDKGVDSLSFRDDLLEHNDRLSG